MNANTNGSDGESERGAKKARVTKAYVNATAGEISRSYGAGATHVRFNFHEEDEVRDVDPFDLPEAIQRACLFHGLAEKLGSAYGAVKNKDESTLDLWQAALDNLMNDVWLREGARLEPMLARAYFEYAVENGKDVSMDQIIKILATDEGQKVGKHPVIAQKVADMKAARAAELAKRARERAVEAGAKDESALALL